MKAGTYKLYPKHSKTPTISEADRTIMAAGNILQRLQQAVATPTEQKLQHNKVIHKLTNILSLRPQRVVDSPEPRVGEQTSLTIDPTARNKVWAARPVHKRATRANPNPIKDDPFPTIWEDNRMMGPAKAPTSGKHQPWPTRRVNGR